MIKNGLSAIWKRSVVVCLCSLSLLWAESVQSAKDQEVAKLFYEDLYGSRIGIDQFYDILRQLARSVGDIPPDIKRIALYQLRVNRQDYSPGMARFFQGKIEETLIKYGRKEMVSIPELRQTRIKSTDTSFVLSNTLPSHKELWKLGEELRLDAYVEASLTRSTEGDVLLNIKVFRHKSAEVVWAGSFIAGPNKVSADFPLLEFGVRLGFGYMPIDRYIEKSTSVSGKGLDVYHYWSEVTVGEASSSSQRLYLNAAAGIGLLSPALDGTRDSVFSKVSNTVTFQCGADLLWIFVNKKNFDDGYWLGAYLGIRALLPQKVMVLRHGYQTRITSHFTLGMGVQFMPLLNRLSDQSILTDGSDYELELANPTYEISIQYAY